MCVYAQTHAEGFIELFHTGLRQPRGYSGIPLETPTGNRTPSGRAWKPPRGSCSADSRPRGQQGAARRCAVVPESREARSAPGSPGETEAGSSRQRGWTNRGVPPAGRHPLLSRPHHARFVQEPARPRSPCPTRGADRGRWRGSTRHEVSAVAEAPGRGEAATEGWGVLYQSPAILRRSPGFAPLSEAEIEAGGAGGKVAPGICAQMGPRCPPRSPEAPRGPASRDTPSHPVVEGLQPRVRTWPPGGSIGSRAPAGPPPLQPPAARAQPDSPLSRAQLPIP